MKEFESVIKENVYYNTDGIGVQTEYNIKGNRLIVKLGDEQILLTEDKIKELIEQEKPLEQKNGFQFVAEVFNYYRLKATLTNFKDTNEQYLLVSKKSTGKIIFMNRVDNGELVYHPVSILDNLVLNLADGNIKELRTKYVKQNITNEQALIDYLISL